jgi:hypothetical protein
MHCSVHWFGRAKPITNTPPISRFLSRSNLVALALFCRLNFVLYVGSYGETETGAHRRGLLCCLVRILGDRTHIEIARAGGAAERYR